MHIRASADEKYLMVVLANKKVQLYEFASFLDEDSPETTAKLVNSEEPPTPEEPVKPTTEATTNLDTDQTSDEQEVEQVYFLS